MNDIARPNKIIVNSVIATIVILLPLPLAWIAWQFMGVPSANPAKELNHLFGRVGFYFLLANINLGSVIAYVRIVEKKWPRELAPLIRYRRQIGVAGFLYLVAHVVLHFVMEAGFFDGIRAIGEAVYLWIGVTAFMLMTSFAVTSNDYSMRRLGKKWKQLHRLAYLAFGLATIHTLMIEKSDVAHYATLAIFTALPLVGRLAVWAITQRRSRRDARTAKR